MRGFRLAVVSLGALGLVAPARAADVERFAVDVGGDGYVQVPSAGLPGAGRFPLGLAASWSDDPLVIRRDGARADSLAGLGLPDGDPVNQRLTVALHAGAGLGKRAAIGLAVPVVGWQAGWNPQLEDPSAELRPLAVGDIAVEGRAALAPMREGESFGLVARLPVSLPTGSAADLAGATGVAAEPGLVGEYRSGAAGAVGTARAAGQLGWRLAPREEILGTPVGRGLRWGVGFGVVAARGVELVAEGTGAWEEASPGGRAGELRLGGRFTLPGGGAIYAAAGTGVGRGIGTPDWRIVLGFTVRPTLTTAG